MFNLFKKKEKLPSYIELVNQTTDVNVFKDSSPFRLKKDEKYIGCKPATLFLYKSDGRIAGHGVTARIKIAKGIYYRAGAGRVGSSKSWQPDQTGDLHFTSDRIIFNGSNKNFSVRWNKVLELQTEETGKQIKIDRETGADWLFQLGENFEHTEFRTIWNMSQGEMV